MLLRRRQQSTSAFRLLVHAGDIVWPALISIFAEGPRTPFFLFFFFVLAAAAYRWGLWETLGTAAAEVALLWIEGFILLHFRLSLRDHRPGTRSIGLRVNVPDFDPYRLFMLSVYLIVMGLLAGLPGRAAKASAGRKGGGESHSVESSSRSGTHRHHGTDLQRTHVDVRRVPVAGRVARVAQPPHLCRRTERILGNGAPRNSAGWTRRRARPKCTSTTFPETFVMPSAMADQLEDRGPGAGRKTGAPANTAPILHLREQQASTR